MRQDELVDYFVNGGSRGMASSMYIEGNVLYSFGHHFPLLVRMEDWKQGQFLMNADRYSSTTSAHQSMCMGHATVMLSFRMLNMAGLDFHRLDLIDTRAAFNEPTGRYHWEKLTGETVEYFDGTKHPERRRQVITKAQYDKLDLDEKSHCDPQFERRPQLVVLRYIPTGKYYLSGMDEQSYFISELPGRPRTVDQAEEMLKPKQFQAFPLLEYVRQGEWFFAELPVSGKVARKVYKALDMQYVLPGEMRDCRQCGGDGKANYSRSEVIEDFPTCRGCNGTGKRPAGNPHTATRGAKYIKKIRDLIDKDFLLKLTCNTPIISGQVKHPEHRTAKLSKLKTGVKLFAAFENRAVASWSSGPLGLAID